MVPRLKWDDSLLTGDVVVDIQHRTLYEIVSELGDAVANGAPREQVEGVLFRTMRYAAAHFTDEEALMERSGYPEMEAHHLLHERFTADVQRFAEEYVREGEIEATALWTFLHGWLVDHIGTHDKALVDYLKTTGFTP